MQKHFDEHIWLEAIQQNDWYTRLADDFKQCSTSSTAQDKEYLYQFFENNLAQNRVALGVDGPNWDKERVPIDTIVIHHTKNPPDITAERLSAMHLLRLYAPHYASPHFQRQHGKDKAIFSHHFKDDRQVFYAYHWLVRMDGRAERLLNDDEIGWHAGNWDINCRSVAICLDGDFERTSPPDVVLTSVAQLMRETYPNIAPSRIVGHSEVNPQTTCPGKNFLHGWKLGITSRV